MLNYIINTKLDLFSVNEKSVEYMYKVILSQREHFPATTKAVLKELVNVELRDLPFEGSIIERNKLINERTEVLINRSIVENDLKVVGENGEIIKPEEISPADLVFEPDTEPEYDSEINCFFANGRRITVTERDDGIEGAKISWKDGSINVNAKCNIYSGSHESTIKTECGYILVEGGTVNNIINGGLHKSQCKYSIITINGGKISFVQGGPSASQKNCHRPHYSGDALLSTTSIDNGEVIINGGTIDALFGGGNGIANTINTKVTMNGGTVTEFLICGSNGNTSKGEAIINGGEIKIFSTTNRGTVGDIVATINGGTIETVYAGGDETYKDVDGTINSVNLTITREAKVTNLKVGTDGGKQIAKDKSSIVVTYKEGTVINVDETTFPNISKI